MSLPRSAFFVDVVSVVDEDLLPFGDGLDAPDAAAVAEPRVVYKAELGVAMIPQRVVHLVAKRGAVLQDAETEFLNFLVPDGIQIFCLILQQVSFERSL